MTTVNPKPLIKVRQRQALLLRLLRKRTEVLLGHRLRTASGEAEAPRTAAARGAKGDAFQGGLGAMPRYSGSAVPLGLLLMVVVLLAPWQPAGPRLAAGQGLGIPTELLGAGETATLSQFQVFQDVLAGLNDNDGGRGRGGRGGTSSGNTGAALVTDPKGFSKLLLSLYTVAGAPVAYNSFNTSQTRLGRRYQPSVRDQGTCDSCVAQAIAAAMEASVASTLGEDAFNVAEFNVSALALYYCTQGWRSCKTGWDIRQALAQVVDEAPWMVRPTSCVTARELTDLAREPEISSWASICASSLDKDCDLASKRAPPDYKQRWINCSFRALSSFADIQHAIRTHGSVVTRMTVYNDFGQHFSGNNSQGFASQPYRVTKGSRPLFGHAVLVTGYDNIGYTWTVQNSWGCSGAGCPSAATGERRPGVTQDGMFKIRMGDAGVSTPDQTFTLACEPAVGSQRDRHSARLWRVRRDMPLYLLRPEDINNLNQSACFAFWPSKPSDTPAAIADAFQLDIRQLARDNPGVFPVINGSLLIRSTMSAQQMANIMHEVSAEAPVGSSGAITPFFRCRTYNGPVIGRPKECRADAGGFAPCAGLSPCWLHFPQQDLAASIQGKQLKVCNISAIVPDDRPEDRVVPYFAQPAARQGRALKALLQVIGVKPRDSARPLKNEQVPASLKEQCNSSNWLPFAAQQPDTVDFNGMLRIRECNPDSRITSISLGWVSLSKDSPNATRDTDRLVNALLSFKDELTHLTLYVSDGALPPQLGELRKLQGLTVYHDCMSGQLPPHLVAGLPQLGSLYITSYNLKVARNDASCGITGPIPPEWSEARSNIAYLDLYGNRLSGTLPSFQKWQQLQLIELNNNGFTGTLPTSWASLRRTLRYLSVPSNSLEGVFPYEWQHLSLAYLQVSYNPNLRGCIPMNASTPIYINNTGITGRCAEKRQEAGELATLRRWLPRVFNSAAAPDTRAWNDTVQTLLANFKPGLRAIIPSGAESGLSRVQPTVRVGNQTVSGDLSISVAVINSTAHVTGVSAGLAGIDLRYLSDLVLRLPQLQFFGCWNCHCKASLGKGACALPADLAAKAPASMFELGLHNITGMASTLPPSWGAWTTLLSLPLRSNKGITGPLPDAWANMASLQLLGLSDCDITGTLPTSWGSGPMAKTMRWLSLDGNQLQGTIPWSWGGFKQATYIDLSRNPMDWNNFCIPDGVVMITGQPVRLCSAANSSQAGTLLSVRDLLRAGSSQPDMILRSWDNPGGAAVGALPNYCKWDGVTCDSTNNVVGLQLDGLPAPAALDNVTNLLLKLPKLSMLELSRLQLSGNLSSPLVARLVMQRQLQHLNLSGNPGIIGELPELWAGSRLQTLDLSGCGIAGPLPPTWAALQQLRVLRLAAAGGQGGQLQSTLPSEWGLLVRLAELDISGHAGITGSLPAAWPNVDAMQAVAAAVVSAAADKVAKAEAALAAAAGQGITPQRGVSAMSAGLGSWPAAQQYEQLTEAASAAATAQHVLTALQAAAAGGSSDTVSAAAAGRGGSLGMRQLQVLRLASCSFSGGLPASFADLQQLHKLDLSHNTGLEGQLPREWGALSKLQILRLASCSLTGGVPATFVTLAGLTELDLSDNMLGGTLPALPFASLDKLASLNLSGNAFEGPLPPLWYGMADAEVIDVSHNSISGPGFPSAWGVPMAGGNPSKLQQLRLSPGNPCMAVSNASVVEASEGACVLVTNVDAAQAANKQGKCAVVYAQEPGGCVP